MLVLGVLSMLWGAVLVTVPNLLALHVALGDGGEMRPVQRLRMFRRSGASELVAFSYVVSIG